MVNDPIARTVSQMMTRFGGDAQLIAQGEPAYDPATSTVVASESSRAIRIIMFDYIKKSDGLGVGDLLIQAGDKQVFVKPADDLPAPKARVNSIIFAGRKYNVLVVKETNPTGSNVLLYELLVRE